MAKAIPMTEVFIMETFPCALDGIGAVQKRFKEGTVDSVPSHLVTALEKSGRISTDEDMVKAGTEEEEDNSPEYTLDYFLDMTKAQMIELLKDEDLTGREKHEDLAKICVSVFADDEEDD